MTTSYQDDTDLRRIVSLTQNEINQKRQKTAKDIIQGFNLMASRVVEENNIQIAATLSGSKHTDRKS
ncbi:MULTISPECIES: hypothetical protein [Brevibacillus]|uniref:Uncharacterized protein n=1 Tax=Brevibacillus laterosporus LMG 15441 TaxID=1042163 RepID=A0A075QZM9_BRELA|nr:MULTISPECIES: hypothetical protein [Brevibacillus]HAS01577.1 hypothetical protein [Brevibacillus sp.]AIG25807.1 hypothetical protein BRLA_c014790 [Brevibacillus laterosporus LMG 15441]AYK07332.1 hypothetical protein D8Z77_13665 [Brevibacillus laterosporus]ERM18445.1 hypothetical protein P615_15480 [Brevibacillus laterosporus PE36]MBA4533402.1 hypothetical protein [Brevibacillus halotolerans]